MRPFQPEAVGHPHDELAYGPGRHERILAFRMPESREVDCNQVGPFRQPIPDGLEGVKALRPGTQQQRMILPLLALCEPDRQSVDGAELRPDGLLRFHRHWRPHESRNSFACWTKE